MTIQIYGSLWFIGHSPLSNTDLSSEIHKFKSTTWINLRPIYCNEKNSKKAKKDDRLYIMEEVKAG